MKKTLKLVLIRHAPVRKTEGFVPENNPNALINIECLKALASHIPSHSTCYVSPLKRAVQTATALAKYVDFREVIADKKLKEQNFGIWEGKKIADVWDELRKNRNQHNFSFMCPETCPPNGESFVDQCLRTRSFIEKINFTDHKALVVIAHAGTIRAFLSYMLELEPNKSIGVEISHLSITAFEVLIGENKKNRGGKYRLLCVNQQ